MPNYAAKMIFQLPPQEWSETWYFSGSSHDAAMSKLFSVAQPRANLMDGDAEIVGFVVSDVDIPGDSRVAYQRFLPVGFPGSADYPWTGELVRCSASATVRRQMTLRGVPDILTETPATGKLTAQALWNTQFIVWRNAMLTAPRFSIRSINSSTTAPTATILDIDVDNATGEVVLSTTAHGLSQLDTIEVNKVDSRPRINGRWKALVIDNTTIKLWGSNIGQITWLGGGVIRLVGYDYLNITDIVDLRKSRRLPGLQRFGTVKGRRSRVSPIKERT